VKLLWILPAFLLPSESWAAKVIVDDLMSFAGRRPPVPTQFEISTIFLRVSPDNRLRRYGAITT
jgi:hypothetical protein